MIPQSKITVSELIRAFPELNKQQAKNIITWMKKPISIMEQEYEEEFPGRYYTWTKAQCVSEIMEKLYKWLDIYSVEAIRDKNFWDNWYWHDTRALYLNTGDAYSVTILYDTRDERFYITTWGDYVEKKRIKDPSEP